MTEITIETYTQTGRPPVGTLSERIRILRDPDQVIQFQKEDGKGTRLEERRATPDEIEQFVTHEEEERQIAEWKSLEVLVSYLPADQKDIWQKLLSVLRGGVARNVFSEL